MNLPFRSITTKTLAWRNIDSPNTSPLENLSPISFRWRSPKDGGEIKEFGFDLELTGFNSEEIKALQMPLFEPGTEEDQGKLDELDPKWIACPHCGKEFDARQG